MTKRVFITGASGCIGHYIAESLINHTNYELYFFVRNPDKLGFDYQKRPDIHILLGDLREIDKFSDLLKTIDIAILAATSWGGKPEVFDVNITSTHHLLKSLDHQRCQQVIYFSTASVLDRQNQLIPEAGEIGTDYISSKYHCLQQISQNYPDFPPLRVLFPTLVLGGDTDKPYSHLSSGLPQVVSWINLIRWFKADASFHFVHAADIATVVQYLVNHPPQSPQPEWLVLGNPPLTLNQAIAETCAYYHKSIYFSISLSLWLANFFIIVFRVQMADWDRFCLNYRHFTYQNPVSPSTFGEITRFPTLTHILAEFAPTTSSSSSSPSPSP
ncbi:NAD-dependent epimerase/dehydratase family protein [Limnospira fusiformis]|nr:NAD(P)-dependent oxidoreductase [Limnospira fusiformis LS22]